MKKETKYELFFLIGAISFIVIFFILTKQASIISFIILENTQNITFDNPEEYIYDSDLIEISNSQVKLKQSVCNVTNSENITDLINNIVGDINGAVFTNNGKFNLGIEFDGDNDIIEIEDNSLLDFRNKDKISVEAWINPYSTSGEQRIVNKDGEGSSNNYFNLYLDGNKAAFKIYTNSWKEIKNNQITLSNNNWYHLVGIYNGTSLGVYVNGVIALKNVDGNIAQNQDNEAVTLAAKSDNSKNFNGIIDEVAIYNKELSYEEVLQHNSTNTELTEIEGMVALWHMENVSTRSCYPSSAIIETQDYQPSRLQEWRIFTTQETLNEQNIAHYYSTDSGLTWNPIVVNSNISLINSTKIRFKSELISDSISTPILDLITISYNYDNCVENWTEQYFSCLDNDTKLKYYIDENSCDTFDNLPIDNGSYIECDFCIPNWIEVNTTCINNTIIGWYNDTNSCYSLTNLVTDNNLPLNNTYNCTIEEINEEKTTENSATSSSEGTGGKSSFTRGEKSETTPKESTTSETPSSKPEETPSMPLEAIKTTTESEVESIAPQKSITASIIEVGKILTTGKINTMLVYVLTILITACLTVLYFGRRGKKRFLSLR